jgi:prepilin-type N-terminal cleavage/methylation domain-containing protein
MKIQSAFNKKGITLIELLVALAISGIVLAGVYQLFISQTRTYAKQDQVVEVQQSVRTAMEILLRDLRMAGFDDDNPSSTISIPIAIRFNSTSPYLNKNSITLNYEYCNKTNPSNPVYEKHTVVYWVDANFNLRRKRIINDNAAHYNPASPYVICHDPATSDQCPEIILTNVNTLTNVIALTFSYGIDANSDGVMDDQNGDNIINAADYLDYNDPKISANSTVVAIRVALTGGPNPTNQEVAKVVSARTLISAVTLRNKCLR